MCTCVSVCGCTRCAVCLQGRGCACLCTACGVRAGRARCGVVVQDMDDQEEFVSPFAKNVLLVGVCRFVWACEGVGVFRVSAVCACVVVRCA